MKRFLGLSIIEFMIALTIGTLIIATIGTIYINNRATYIIQEGLARLQENGRFANYYLARQLRMAGYQGCSNQEQITVTNLVQNVSTALDYDKPLEGYDGLGSSFSPLLPSNISDKGPLATSDVLEIRMASPISTQLSNDMGTASDPILVYPLSGSPSGLPMMITNCIVGNIFIAGTTSTSSSITHSTPQNTSSNLSMAYPSNSLVMPYLYYAFYIKNSGRFNSLNEPIPALFRLDYNGNEEEIAEGVEQMHIFYGVDTDANNAADTYQTATQVDNANNWNNVISIQISLLFATIENVNDKSQSYTYNGSTTTPTDKKIRRQWDTFVTLRNRGLPS